MFGTVLDLCGDGLGKEEYTNTDINTHVWPNITLRCLIEKETKVGPLHGS